MIKLHFEKLSRYPRFGEFAEAAVPFRQGLLQSPDGVILRDGERTFAPQARATAQWPDGSVKWLHIGFLADLPANAAKDYFLELSGETNCKPPEVTADLATGAIDTGVMQIKLAPKGSGRLLDSAQSAGAVFGPDELVGPVLKSGGESYTVRLDNDWEFCEKGPVRVIVRNSGKHVDAAGNTLFDFAVRLHFTAGHPWFLLEYRFINKEKAASLPLESLTVRVKESDKTARTALGISNYRTDITETPAETGVEKLIDAEYLLYTSNEQDPATMYGTFFTDWCAGEKGVCATVYQAQQNFPKALRANRDGMLISLMPEGQEPINILQGMSKTHHVFFHLHNGAALSDLDIRSLQMQMPDRPVLDAAVYKEAGVLENIFTDAVYPKAEEHMMARADATARSYGMLAWGDTMDKGYTEQGRGKGKIVWTNNEYDFPHASLLMFARTGERRYFDRLLVAARHWMDVDICHYSEDPLRRGAQIMHSANHVTEKCVPSHEWVEGLFDYFHLTGDKRGYHCAIGIGDNVLALLDTPMFQKKGEINARETGWALRTLVALYNETGDEKWLAKCEWIVGHFVEWKKEFGEWFSPYTDHTVIRVPFMIAVAVNSLMRYYRVRPSDKIKTMIVDAARDLVDNTRLPSGLFYYKELPGLRHTSVNCLVLEALSYAYELTGETEYLTAGLPNCRAVMAAKIERGGAKKAVEDAVLCGGESTKSFAQSHVPFATYIKALETAGLIDQI